MEVSDVSESKNGKPFPIEESNDLIVYDPSPLHDSLVLGWWARMISEGELERFITKDALILSNFMNRMRSPSTLLFKANGDVGIWFAAVLTPCFDGAFFDMWIDKTKRTSRAWVEAMEEALNAGFNNYPVLIGATGQENLIDGHIRLGYTLVGKIPGLWNGGDVHLLYITRELFNAREVHARRA